VTGDPDFALSESVIGRSSITEVSADLSG